MYVILIRPHILDAQPQVRAMEDSRVYNDRGDCRKGQAVRQCKGGGEEQWGIGIVLGEIQGVFWREDLVDLVKVSRIVV